MAGYVSYLTDCGLDMLDQVGVELAPARWLAEACSGLDFTLDESVLSVLSAL